jgi:hypothetical protein
MLASKFYFSLVFKPLKKSKRNLSEASEWVYEEYRDIKLDVRGC